MYTVKDFRDKFNKRMPDIQEAKGHFSVLVPVIDIGGQANILYELRSPYVDRQPGEVCFPGGEIEPGETSRQAVIRETFEETGIKEENIDIIAQLDTYHPASGIVIYPFLAEVEKEALDHLNLAPAEVAEVFLVPVSFFMENEPYRYKHYLENNLGTDFDYSKIGLAQKSYGWRPMESEIISWEFDGKFIWGLTAKITDWTLKIMGGARD